jgi:peptidyl-tRNA hydrolase, PTH1 family
VPLQLRRKVARPDGGDEAVGPWIVLGLGNPDDEYGNTRHNAGAMVVAVLAERAGAKLKRSRNRAQVAEIRDGDARVVLARPNSYVNESGGPASLLARWYKTPVERIIVVHDEIDLPHGKLQLRRDGGTAGHNGLKDVAKALGSPDFLRVRIGVGRPPGRKDPADYVLEPIAKRDAEDFAVLVERAADAAMDLVHLPLERAQDRHNH